MRGLEPLGRVPRAPAGPDNKASLLGVQCRAPGMRAGRAVTEHGTRPDTVPNTGEGGRRGSISDLPELKFREAAPRAKAPTLSVHPRGAL